MTEQTPNEVDRSGQKVGLWTEVDSHGGVMVGEYVEGKRQGVWRHYFVDGSVRSEGTYDERRRGRGVDLVPRDRWSPPAWRIPGFREARILGALGCQWEPDRPGSL